MSSELPENWVSCEIGEVAKVVGGGTPPSKDPTNFTAQGGTPWITPADLSGYKDIYINRGARNLSDKGFAACSAAKMPPGSVLFSSRAPVGYVAIASSEVTTNQGFKSFVLPDSVDSRFVYYYLRHIKPVAEMMATGTTFKELSGSAAAKLPFILAPLNEQKRIADKLDSLLARVDACREKLDRVPLILKRFRQAVLFAATSGQLTEDWRDSAESLGSWRTVTLAQVAKARLGKMLDKAKNQGEPTPYLRNINVRWFEFDLSDILEIKVSEREAQELSIRYGDVLVCEGGEPGRCAVWRGVEDAYVYQKALHRVRVGDELMPDWLCYCLKAAADSGSLASLFTGTTIKHLTGIALAQFEFKLPPIEKQHEIVCRVETLFAFADRLEARYCTGREQVDQLTPSILDKAFRGDLVPQDPNDEPAAKLLERIKNARAQITENPQRGKRRRLDSKVEANVIDPSQIQADHLSSILRRNGRQTAKALWKASQLSIEDFYEQLRAEEAKGLLREVKKDAECYLEAA